MSEFKVTDTHEGVSVSITVNIPHGCTLVSPEAQSTIFDLADATMDAAIEARKAARDYICDIAEAVGSSLNSVYELRRQQKEANAAADQELAIGNAVTAERARLQEIHTGQLKQRDDELADLRAKLDTRTRRSAQRAGKAGRK